MGVVERVVSLRLCSTEQFTLANGSPQWFIPCAFAVELHIENWIQVVEYFAYSFLNSYATNVQIRNIVDRYDFYIFPVVNPDGKLQRRLSLS